jgi:hypothetical protein
LATPSGRSRATQRARRARSTTATTRSTSFCRQTAPPRTAAKKRVTGAELRRRLAADGIVVRCELDSSSERGLFTEAVRAFRELVDGTGVHGPPLGREVTLPQRPSDLLFADWLGELIFLAEMPRRVIELDLHGGGLRGTIEVPVADRLVVEVDQGLAVRRSTSRAVSSSR